MPQNMPNARYAGDDVSGPHLEPNGLGDDVTGRLPEVKGLSATPSYRTRQMLDMLEVMSR